MPRYDPRRLRISPGSMIAVVALVLAGTSGAMAVTQRSSGRSVAAKGPRGLRGPRGIPGLAGATGQTGLAGSTGAQGNAGKIELAPYVATLPSGNTETGVWNVEREIGPEKPGELIQVPFSFPIPLAKPLFVNELRLQLLEPEQPPNAQCPGSLTKPTAAPGDLCVYSEEIGEGTNLAPVERTAHSYTSGVVLQFFLEPGGAGHGTWAVTAE